MPAREEGALLAAPGRDIAVTAVVVVLTAGVFVAVGDHGTQMSIKRWDDTWLRLMISGRAAPLTAIARILNVLGLVYITLPVRIAIAGLLALQRKWWHLAAFIAAVAVSEVLIGVLKGIYDRARPQGSLVATTGASFPSGHAVATSVTAVAAVIALVPPGRRRAWWGAAAVMFSVLMGLSRAYLAAHWLSDAVAGVLLGTSCALTAALVVGLVQRWWQGRRQQPAAGHRMASVPPPDQVAGRRRTA
jgi:undecaprenyl-diphosphatase